MQHNTRKSIIVNYCPLHILSKEIKTMEIFEIKLITYKNQQMYKKNVTKEI